MNRPRIPLGLESSRATLNPDVCTRLGEAFAAARANLGLDVREVGARLLLSPCQVTGLEHGDAEAFYSAELYLVAARKYDALVGLESPLLEEVLVRPEPEEATSRPAVPVLAFARPVLRHARPLAAAAVVLAVSATVGWYVLSLGWPVSHPADGAAVSTPAAAPSLTHLVSAALPAPRVAIHLSAPPAPVVPVSTASVSERSADERYGHVRVQRATWIFVRYRDNSTVERVLAPGERFVLQGMPIYIAAGAASGAEVVVDGEVIDVDRFDVDGQLRIGSAFLSAALR